MNAAIGYHHVVAMSNREEELFLPEGCIYAGDVSFQGSRVCGELLLG